MSSSCISFWLVGGEVNRSQHHQPSGSNLSGVYFLVGSMPLTSPTWWEFQYLHNSSQTVLCASLEVVPGPCPKASLLFLYAVSPLSGHLLLSLISSSLNLPLDCGEGHGGWMKPISYNQELGDTERLLCPGAPEGPAGYQRYSNLAWVTREGISGICPLRSEWNKRPGHAKIVWPSCCFSSKLDDAQKAFISVISEW